MIPGPYHSNINTKWAFAHYQAIRHSLPTARFPNGSQRVTGLADLSAEFDVFLLDAFGVLNVGHTAVPSAPAQVAALQAAGKRVMVLTNGASFPATEAQKKYRQLGFNFSLDNIVASRDALAHGLQKSSAPQGLWGVMASPGSQVNTLAINSVSLGEEPSTYQQVDGFILLGASHWSAKQQQLLQQSLEQKPRPVWVGNPDLVAPRESDFSLEPGYFAHQLSAIPGVEPQFFGKPFAEVYALTFARLGKVSKSKVVMVGDTLHTDILGGAAFGLKTALVTDHGLFAKHPVQPFIDACGIVPDFIMASP
jgi:HAD superfamily hydrolase (TIGR01450 family)